MTNKTPYKTKQKHTVREHFTRIRMSFLHVKGCKTWAYAQQLLRQVYRSTPAVTQDLALHDLTRDTAPFSCLLQQTMGLRTYSYSDHLGHRFAWIDC